MLIRQGKAGLISVFPFRFSFVDIRTETEYQILTFKILLWHSHCVGKSFFHIQNSIFTYALSRIITVLIFKIQFCHSLWGGIPILTFKTLFWDSHPVLTIKILFCHSHWVAKFYFDIQRPILTFSLSLKIVFWHSRFYFEFALSLNIIFWHSKSYFDILVWVEM